MDADVGTYPRHIEPTLRAALADTPAVCLIGPRQAGKTTLAKSLAPGRAYVSFDDASLCQTARGDPAGFVAGLPDFVTLDEVQRAPDVLPAIKMAVDRDRRPGRFLLTGSANLLLLPQVHEPLVGRMEVVTLYPLTEAEKQRRPGAFLADFLAGRLKPNIVPDLEPTEDLPARIAAGGYPEPVARDPVRARQWHRQYLRALLQRDVRDIARIRHEDDLNRLLELLALRTGELLNTSGLGGDLQLYRDTVDHYLAVLERLFLIRRLPAWHRNPSRRLIKTPKVHLVDSGLSATLAGLKVADWLTQRPRFGHLLESFVVQQLIAQAGWTDPDLRFWHYRDKDQVEVDVVMTQGARVWGVEVKASATVSPGDGQGLRRLAERAGRDFQGGLVLHTGSSTLPLAHPQLLAAPLKLLWSL